MNLDFTLLLVRGKQIFSIPWVIFSRTLSMFKHELPENCLFRSQFWLPPSAKYKKLYKNIYKNLYDLKLIFLEIVHPGLCSGKVWENRFFLSCMTLVDPYSKLLLMLLQKHHLFLFLNHLSVGENIQS